MKAIGACGRVYVKYGKPQIYNPFFVRPRPPAITDIWRDACALDAWYRFSDGTMYHYSPPAAADATAVANAMTIGTYFNRHTRRLEPDNRCIDKVTVIPPHMEHIYHEPPYRNTVPPMPTVPYVFGLWSWDLQAVPTGGFPNITTSFDGTVCPCISACTWIQDNSDPTALVSWNCEINYNDVPRWVYLEATGSVPSSSFYGMVVSISDTWAPILNMTWNPGDSNVQTRAWQAGTFGPDLIQIQTTMGGLHPDSGASISFRAWSPGGP